jgi:hypothetical protein
MEAAMAEPGFWGVMAAGGFSPFKVVCTAHRGSQMVRRGAARTGPGGMVELQWEVYRGRGAPAAGDGMYDAEGLATFGLECPKCGHPREIRRERLVGLLRDRARAGVVDAKGRVVLDLAELAL